MTKLYFLKQKFELFFISLSKNNECEIIHQLNWNEVDIYRYEKIFIHELRSDKLANVTDN